jgi:hypothetical protein
MLVFGHSGQLMKQKELKDKCIFFLFILQRDLFHIAKRLVGYNMHN